MLLQEQILSHTFHAGGLFGKRPQEALGEMREGKGREGNQWSMGHEPVTLWANGPSPSEDQFEDQCRTHLRIKGSWVLVNDSLPWLVEGCPGGTLDPQHFFSEEQLISKCSQTFVGKGRLGCSVPRWTSYPGTAIGEAERCRHSRGQTVGGHGATVWCSCRGTQRWPRGGGPGTNYSCSKKLGGLGVWPLAFDGRRVKKHVFLKKLNHMLMLIIQVCALNSYPSAVHGNLSRILN